jgi:hypothetical protein
MTAEGADQERDEGKATKFSDSRISGALYDLLGYLTTREESFTVGSKDTVYPLMEHLKAWSELRGFDMDEAEVIGWNTLPTAASADEREEEG